MLTSAEIDQFFEHGFLGPFRAFSESEMAGVREVIETHVIPTPTLYCSYPTHVRHLDSETVFNLCNCPAIVDMMETLYGPDLLLWSSSLFAKPPARPDAKEEYPWHRDMYNWSLQPMVNISAWLAITDTTIENGCIEFYPGSHKVDIPCLPDTAKGTNDRFKHSADPSFLDESKAVSVPMRAGEFVLFNERTLHHSNPNQTDDVRMGIGIRVTLPVVRVREEWPCVLLRGEDRSGLNTLVKPPAGEPDICWSDNLEKGDVYLFDRPIPGVGWHIPESDGERCFAWTSGDEAWVDLLPVSTGDVLLQCEILHAISPDVVQGVELWCDGERLAMSFRQGDGTTIVEAPLPNRKDRGEGSSIRIFIKAPGAQRPCDLNAESKDNRRLGLGVSRIGVVPAV